MKTLAQIKQEVSAGYQDALASARRACGRGIYRSRGKWIVVTDCAHGIGHGEMEWDGTKKQLDRIVAEYTGKQGIDGIYIDGGIDFGENFAAFDEGWYEPWVGEYSVTIWQKGE